MSPEKVCLTVGRIAIKCGASNCAIEIVPAN